MKKKRWKVELLDTGQAGTLFSRMMEKNYSVVRWMERGVIHIEAEGEFEDDEEHEAMLEEVLKDLPKAKKKKVEDV